MAAVGGHFSPAVRLARCDHPDVRVVLAHAARRPRRRRSRQSQAVDPRRLRPTDRAWALQLVATRPAGAAQDRAGRARGDERDRRPGDPVPGPAAAGALRDDQPVDRVRRRHFSASGPPRQRLPAGPDPRRSLHLDGQRGVQLLQGLSADALPNPDQVPRRGASARRHPARPRVRHEGLLLLRHRRRRPQERLPRTP